MTDDAQLMVRVRGGDAAALGELMERWELPLKGFLGRIVQNSAEADDLAQEAFVRVWQQRSRFRPGADFRPWLFSIAVNLARNRLRWWRRRPAVSLEEWDGADPGDPAGGAAALEKRERAEAVRAAVAALPASFREALVLFEYQGFSHVEMGAALGCSAKAAESRLHRAREALRRPLRRWIES